MNFPFVNMEALAALDDKALAELGEGGGPSAMIDAANAIRLLRKLPVGSRVRLRRDIDRYPHFIAPEGATGTVVWFEHGVFAVGLDLVLAGAEDWENEVHWFNDHLEDGGKRVREDLELIEAGSPGYDHAKDELAEPFPGYDANVSAGLPPDGDTEVQS